mgnify:CR=1 FL=1
MSNQSAFVVAGILTASLVVLASRSASAGAQSGALVRVQSSTPRIQGEPKNVSGKYGHFKTKWYWANA